MICPCLAPVEGAWGVDVINVPDVVVVPGRMADSPETDDLKLMRERITPI